jgi:hypothetical protein
MKKFRPLLLHVTPTLDLLDEYGLADRSAVNVVEFLNPKRGSRYEAIREPLRFTVLTANGDSTGLVYWNDAQSFTSTIVGWRYVKAVSRGDGVPSLSDAITRTVACHSGKLEEPALSEAAMSVRRHFEEVGLRLCVEQEPEGLILGMETPWENEWDEGADIAWPHSQLATLPWAELDVRWFHRSGMPEEAGTLATHGWTLAHDDDEEIFRDDRDPLFLEHKYFHVIRWFV